MKKMKIVQIIPSFGIGGAEKLVLDYLQYFDKDEVDICAISMYSKQNSSFDDIIEKKGLNVYYLDKKSGLDLSMIWKINSIIKQIQPDIIHCHLAVIKYIFFSIVNKKDIRTFHTIHNEPDKDARGLDKFINKLAYKTLNVIPIALTSDMAAKTNNYYNINNTLVVNNGVFLDEFTKENFNVIEKKKSLGLHENDFIIGHVGRFSKQKNHNFLLEIFSEVCKNNRNSYLLLVGDGELRQEIEDKAKILGVLTHVKFLGVRNDISHLVQIMDVFLFPSLHEGFPITLIEAQAAKVRCVISNEIDENVILSSQTIALSLSEPVGIWSQNVLSSEIVNTSFKSIEKYDIRNSTKLLLEIYSLI